MEGTNFLCKVASKMLYSQFCALHGCPTKNLQPKLESDFRPILFQFVKGEIGCLKCNKTWPGVIYLVSGVITSQGWGLKINVLKVIFHFGIEIWCCTTIIRDVTIMCMNKKHWLISRICKCLRSERHLPNISSTQSIPGSPTYCHIAINAECTYMQGLRCQSPIARGGKWNLGCGGGNGVPLILLAHHYFPPETRNASVLLRGRVYLLFMFRHNLTWTLKSELGIELWNRKV